MLISCTPDLLVGKRVSNKYSRKKYHKISEENKLCLSQITSPCTNSKMEFSRSDHDSRNLCYFQETGVTKEVDRVHRMGRLAEK